MTFQNQCISERQCPFCNFEEIEYTSYAKQGDSVCIGSKCPRCGKAWIDFYGYYGDTVCPHCGDAAAEDAGEPEIIRDTIYCPLSCCSCGDVRDATYTYTHSEGN